MSSKSSKNTKQVDIFNNIDYENLPEVPIFNSHIRKEIIASAKKYKNTDLNNEKTTKYSLLTTIFLVMILTFIVVGLAIFIGYFLIDKSTKRFQDYEIELGETNVTLENFLKNSEDIENSKLFTDLETITFDKIGKYPIELSYNDKKETVNLNIVDTTKPELKLKAITIYNDEKMPTKDDFIESVSDLSHSITTALETAIDSTLIGDQEIVISATDESGNKREEKTILTIKKDETKPVFKGLTNLTVDKNGKVDYEKGVSVTDDRDGTLKFTYDASAVDLAKSGTYFVTYTATDSSGNVATSKRKITVASDKLDTNSLVQKVADSLSSDPEKLRDYCRNNIKYSHNDGGNDPVYYGLTKHNGDCYVHAMCFKSLLDAKGIENQLIWVTDKSHYWNLVFYNGGWWHLDSTPSGNHSKVFLSDAQKLADTGVHGKTWDTSAWPASPTYNIR